MEIFCFLVLEISLLLIIYSIATVCRVKRQISEVLDALNDIKNGNGNRRILARTNEMIAPLIYEINSIVISYENKLSMFHRVEEANRRFMTSLSHDVKTPLTTLIGYLDAAYKGTVTGREYDNYIEIAHRKSHELKNYIDMLFDWFKLNSNEFIIKIDTMEVAELTRNVLIDWIPIFENKQMEYHVSIPEQPFLVRLDPDGYTRILNNLIQNVIVHSYANKIKISLCRFENDIKIQISDNGIGMKSEDLKHIFERLYKCDKGYSKKGSGLGLFIAYQLTEKMNGKIVVESEVTKGTVFTLLFPLAI